MKSQIDQVKESLMVGVYGKIQNAGEQLFKIVRGDDKHSFFVISDHVLMPEKSFLQVGDYITPVSVDEIYDVIKISPCALLGDHLVQIVGWEHDDSEMGVSIKAPVPQIEGIEFKPYERDEFLAYVRYDYDPLVILHVYENPFPDLEDLKRDHEKLRRKRELVYSSFLTAAKHEEANAEYNASPGGTIADEAVPNKNQFVITMTSQVGAGKTGIFEAYVRRLIRESFPDHQQNRERGLFSRKLERGRFPEFRIHDAIENETVQYSPILIDEYMDMLIEIFHEGVKAGMTERTDDPDHVVRYFPTHLINRFKDINEIISRFDTANQ